MYIDAKSIRRPSTGRLNERRGCATDCEVCGTSGTQRLTGYVRVEEEVKSTKEKETSGDRAGAREPERGTVGEKSVSRREVLEKMGENIDVVMGLLEADDNVALEKSVGFVLWEKKLERVGIEIDRSAL